MRVRIDAPALVRPARGLVCYKDFDRLYVGCLILVDGVVFDRDLFKHTRTRGTYIYHIKSTTVVATRGEKHLLLMWRT